METQAEYQTADEGRQTHLKCRAAECTYRVTVPFAQALREWPRHHGVAMMVDEQVGHVKETEEYPVLVRLPDGHVRGTTAKQYDSYLDWTNGPTE